ncbi:hypothetical protein OIU76_018098 [Salix suchowensis]|nr:hypothetical protein OIU76_018098 [Salix suchowensis]
MIQLSSTPSTMPYSSTRKCMEKKESQINQVMGGNLVAAPTMKMPLLLLGLMKVWMELLRWQMRAAMLHRILSQNWERPKNLAPAKLKNCVDSLGPDPYVDPSNGGAHAQTLNGCLYSHGTEDYNQLLNQYYELEEKRQMILQQLNVYYQYPVDDSGSGGYWGTCSASQDQLVAATQASLTPLICSCCPYACHCSVAPCSSFSSCTLGGTSLGKACADSSPMMNPGKSFPPMDDDIVKTAMDAAERAMSSMTMNAPAVKSDTEGNKAEKSEDNGGEITQNTSSETDLTVVLNAWYSAGFYTGKYLTERSIAKK